MHTVLVTSVGKTGIPNIITLAWTMPTSIVPPQVAISVAKSRHSHQLIEESREFIVNIPTVGILRQTIESGRISGKNLDKFLETKLTSAPGRKTKAPIIQECVAHLECKLSSQLITGDHTIFVGEVVEAYANKGIFTDKYDLAKAKFIFHLGQNKFASLNSKLLSV